jgi:hypothetical protein
MPAITAAAAAGTTTRRARPVKRSTIFHRPAPLGTNRNLSLDASPPQRPDLSCESQLRRQCPRNLDLDGTTARHTVAQLTETQQPNGSDMLRLAHFTCDRTGHLGVHLPKTILIYPSLPTSAAQLRLLTILLPAGICRSCHDLKAITPMQYRLIVGRVRGREAIVAGVGTLHKGFSIEYAWAQVGSAAERRQAAGYYIGAAEGGEPPGAAGGARVPRRWGSATARRSSASPMTWCSASVCTR